MHNKLFSLVSIPLACAVLLSGCSSNDKLSDGKWTSSDSHKHEAILKVDGDDFSLKSYDGNDLEGELTGKINRSKRALVVHKADFGKAGSWSLTSKQKKSVTQDDVLEYKFDGKTLVIRGDDGEDRLTKE